MQYGDGREEHPGPVADSDEELVELIQVLAAHAGLTSRPFDSANPQLDLRLPDGSRLSAVMCRTSPSRYRPVITGSGPPMASVTAVAIWPIVVTRPDPMLSGVSPPPSRAVVAATTAAATSST